MKNLFILFLFMSSFNLFSDDMKSLKVLDINKLNNEFVSESIVDANGEQAICIKITTDLSSLLFDSGNGVVRLDKKPGEYYVYLQNSERLLNIYKEGFAPLKLYFYDYDFRVKPGEVYELKLSSDKDFIEFRIYTNPKNTIKIIKGKEYKKNLFKLTKGTYKIKIKKTGYEDIQKNILLDENNNFFEFNLKKIHIIKPLNLDKIIEAKKKKMKNTKINEKRMRNKNEYIKENFSFIQGGEFVMGSEIKEDEKPLHRIKISDFYMAKTELIQKDYELLIDENPSYFKGKEKPVHNVNFWKVIEYCNKLSNKQELPIAYDKKGNLLDKNKKITKDIKKVKGYRLPTEAEWEYVAKGTYNLNKQSINYENSQGVSNVAKKQANKFGIYDMIGNVEEWCYDYYNKDYYSKSKLENPYNYKKSLFRVSRGGSLFDSIEDLRTEKRKYYINATEYAGLGFRLVLSAEN